MFKSFSGTTSDTFFCPRRISRKKKKKVILSAFHLRYIFTCTTDKCNAVLTDVDGTLLVTVVCLLVPAAHCTCLLLPTITWCCCCGMQSQDPCMFGQEQAGQHAEQMLRMTPSLIILPPLAVFSVHMFHLFPGTRWICLTDKDNFGQICLDCADCRYN